MATWTSADVATLKAAIAAVAAGDEPQTISYDGPPKRSVTYHPADLEKMRALLAEMLREVNSTTRYRRVGWGRGFRE